MSQRQRNELILRRQGSYARLLVLLLFAAAVLAVSAAVTDSDRADAGSGDSGNIHWDVSNGTLTISKKAGATSGAMPDYDKGDHPWPDAGYDTVVIQTGITYIGEFAFYDADMKSVKIAESVTKIGNGAFEECEYLEGHLKLPAVLEKIGKYSFKNCKKLTEVTIPISVDNAVDEDQRDAFQNVASVKTIHFLKGTGKGYDYSSDLRNNTLPYKSHDALTEVTFEEGITHIGKFTLYGAKNLKSVTFPSSLKTVGDGAFEDAGLSGHLNLPAGLEKIGKYSFKNCDGLREVSIPISVDMVVDDDDDNDAFDDVEHVTTVNFLKGTGKGFDYSEDERDNTLTYHSRNTITVVTFEEGIYHIGERLFYKAAVIGTLTFPTSLKTIGKGAFEECNLTGHLNLPASLTSIGKYAFKKCANITELTIPISVDTVVDDDNDNEVFYGVERIGKIHFLKGTGVGASYNNDNRDNTPMYSSRDCLTEVTFDEGIRSIGAYTLYDGHRVESLKLPSTLNVIEIGAFEGCSAASGSLVLPDGMTSLGKQAFRGCSNITSLTLPINLDAVVDTGSSQAFYGVSRLTSVSFTTGTGYSCNYTDDKRDETPWYNSRGTLTSVTFTDGIVTIGNSILWGCSNVAEVKLPQSLTQIGSSAFEGLSKIPSITIYDKVETIGKYAFKGCSSASSLHIGNRVKDIQTEVFQGCGNFDRIYFGTSIRSITDGAFGGYVFFDSDGAVEIPISADGMRGYNYEVAPGSASPRKMIRLYEVFFEPQGGKSDVLKTYSNTDGKLSSMPEATREGYTLVGWFDDPVAGNQYTTDTLITTYIHLYAHWDYVVPTSVTLDPSVVEVPLLTSFTLGITVEPYSAASVVWTTSDINVVMVTNGVLIPISAGEAVVTATVNGTSGSAQITVVDHVPFCVTFDANGGESDTEVEYTDSNGHLQKIPSATRERYTFAGWYDEVEGGREITTSYTFRDDKTVYAHWDTIPVDHVEISRQTATLFTDSVVPLVASIVPANATDQRLIWTSSNESVVKVMAGVISAVAVGEAVVTVSSPDPGATPATCTVYVVEPTGIPHEVVFDPNGGKCDVESLDTDAKGFLPYVPVADRDFYKFRGWFIAGKQFPVTTETFFAEDTLVTAMWDEIPVDHLVLSVYEVSLSVGEQVQIGCSVVPANATAHEVIWMPEDVWVATVSPSGVVTAVGEGDTAVRAYAGNVFVSCVVHVKDVDALVAELDESRPPSAIVTNADEILEGIQAARTQEQIPRVEISASSSGSIVLPNKVIRTLAVPQGKIYISTPYGYLSLVDGLSILDVLVVSGTQDDTLYINSASVNSDLDVVCAVRFFLDGATDNKFTSNVELGIKYLLTDAIDKYSLYRFDEGKDPVKIDMGYRDGMVYFFADGFSTYGLVYGGEDVPESGTDYTLIMIVAVAGVVIAVVAAALIIRKKRKSEDPDYPNEEVDFS